jgi:ribosomal protein S18 acetylase RimI-like enzyme
MPYKILRPTISEALALTKLHNQSWIETYPNEEHGVSKEYIEKRVADRLSEEGIKRREDAIQKSYDDPTYFLRIAKDDTGRIVGFIDGHVKDNECWLDGLYTLKSTHGSGLGQLLWEAYLPWTNYNDVLLTVATYNDRARAFYRKLGFENKAGTERYFADTPIPVVDMVRIIR